MPRVIFRFGGLPVLFFILARNKMHADLMNYEFNQNGCDIFPQVQL